MNYMPPSEKYTGYYYERKRLENGQVCELRIYEDIRKKSIIYYVAFAIANKKKDLTAYLDSKRGSEKLCLHSTGKTLEGLMWAKNQILNFKPSKHGKITIAGEDKRRYHTYKTALAKYGFKEENTQYGFVLTKPV